MISSAPLHADTNNPLCTQITHPPLHNTLHIASCLLIDLPPKIWRPKVTSKYTLPDYSNDVDKGIFDYKCYGKCVFRPKHSWDPGTRSDIITFKKTTDSEELTNDLRIGASASKPIRTRVIILVQKYWDSFAKKGCKRPIIGFDFSIGTGTAKPVCCKKTTCGFYKNNIIMQQITELLNNRWIRLCQGPWGSIIVLAAKPHQEKCTNINDFI